MLYRAWTKLANRGGLRPPLFGTRKNNWQYCRIRMSGLQDQGRHLCQPNWQSRLECQESDELSDNVTRRARERWRDGLGPVPAGGAT